MPRFGQILADSDLRPMTADTITDPDQIMTEIEKTRARGYGFVVNESAPSEVTVAAAVLDAAGRPVAAVHIAGSLTKWSPGDYEERFSPFVVETARALSHSGSGLRGHRKQRGVMSVVAGSERRIADWLAERRGAMVSLLSDLVCIDSGTANISGRREGCASESRISLADRTSLQRRSLALRHGRGLRVEVPASGHGKSMLLMGHLDTVFPAGRGSRAAHSRSRADGRAALASPT